MLCQEGVKILDQTRIRLSHLSMSGCDDKPVNKRGGMYLRPIKSRDYSRFSVLESNLQQGRFLYLKYHCTEGGCLYLRPISGQTAEANQL